jgi:cell division septal protein FtsQ
MKRRQGSRTRQKPARRKQGWLGRVFSWKVQTGRYQVALPVWSGAQRKVERRALPPRLISAALLVVAGWLVYWFSNADCFYITSVRVEGHWRLPEAELLAISGLEGINVFWADTQAAERALEALPDVASAHVRCGLPADCVIRLVERPAKLVWRQGDAQVWIGAGGVALPARGELPNALVLDAVDSTALRPGDQLDPALVAAVEVLEQKQPEVRVYQYSDRYGLSFNSAYGWPVHLGDGREIALKLNLASALTDYFLDQGIVPAFVDVRYPEAPYYGE